MKTKNPKKPAAKPAKTPKPPLPPNAWESFSRTLPEPEAIIAEAIAIIHAVDAAAKPPFSLPSIPPALAGAVRPLLAAARLPAGALPPTVARLAAILEEWDRRMCDDSATDAVFESFDELDRREFRLDPNAYRRAELARVSARVTADALQVLRPLSPKAARAAAEEARPRFADVGAAVMEYLAAPLPGMDAEEVFLSRIEDALAALADAARNPATPPASPSNAADVETVARIEAKVDELAARKRKGKPLGKRCEVSWKTAAGELGLSARTLQRYAANPGSVPDSLRGFCRAVLRTRTAFDTWRVGLGAHEGAKARMKETADRLGGNYRGMRVGRRP